MNPGYVYILTNDAMPGIVKIGRTAREVDVRAAELFQTGVPEPFFVYGFEKTPNCAELEAYMHRDLRKHRVNRSREFFSVDPEVAIERLHFWTSIQAYEFVQEHFSCISAVPYWLKVPEHAVERLAADLGEDTWAITEAMAVLTQEELLPALRRAKVIERERIRDEMESLLEREADLLCLRRRR